MYFAAATKKTFKFRVIGSREMKHKQLLLVYVLQKMCAVVPS